MSNRASIRRIEKVEASLRAEGREVVNLCGRPFRLGSLQQVRGTIPRCYASALGNCIGPISREHYISENILAQLDSVPAGSIPWLQNQNVSVAPKDLFVANCLCKYHNEFLSPLDSLAGKAFDNFALLYDQNSPNVLIWGPSLARWCLKALVGLVASKNVVVEGEKLSPSDLPPEWIEILFGILDFPAGLGLYMTPTVGSKIEVGKRIMLSTLLLQGRLQGVRMSIGGVEFLLSMADPNIAFIQESPAFKTLLYLPRALNMDKRANRMMIFWD